MKARNLPGSDGSHMSLPDFCYSGYGFEVKQL